MRTINSNKYIIIAPAGTGKTTLARHFPTAFSDPDDARVASLEPKLKELRRANNWPEHNRLWHEQLTAFDKARPQHKTLLVHSLSDALAVANRRPHPARIAFLLIPQDTHAAQISNREPEARALAMRNYSEAVADAAKAGFPVFTSVADIPNL